MVAKAISDTTVNPESTQSTIKTYRDYLYKQFGESLIKRIQTHYEFDLDVMMLNATPLTPEIIYRINVGTSHIEACDIEQLALDLKNNNALPERIKQKIGADTHLQLNPKNPSDFAELVELLRVKQEDHDKIFTGRKLHGKISSWYTQGDDTLFKPWVDQQEFTQTCFQIPNRNWDCFYEDLAMILCKKHLHQKNPDGTYRVGALIPAPKEEGKPQSYYKVTSWIHNSRGIFSYTLEPACPGTGLAAIKLYRSTSVSAYNLDGASSYKNDFNPINPPGYEGAHLLEPYESEFFNSKTIPAWVGYHHLAKTCAEPAKALKAANDALISEIKAKYKKPSLEQFIRKYDSEFMELIHSCREAKLINPYKAWYLLNNSLRNTVKYKYTEESKEVKRLKSFLEQASKLPQTAAQASELLSWWSDAEQMPSEAEQALIKELRNFELTPHKTRDWSNYILDYAKEKKEDIASKQAQDIRFVGHSLGAACAQQFLVNYTAAKGRIPLPGHQVAAQIFDDPAINTADNNTFIAFGNKHADLLVALDAKFAIIRRQEAGDPVPQSGETHLGAAETPELQQKMNRWLRFDAALQKPSSRARDPQIRDYTTAHGRLYAGASSRHAWQRRWIRKRLPKIQKTDPKLAIELKEILSNNPDADYKKTNYDSRTQWNFDHPSTSRIWTDLRKQWKLPFRFTPIYAERLRTYLSAAFRSGYFLHVLPGIIAQLGKTNPPCDTAHGDWKKHCDSKGVFVVPRPLGQFEE